MVFCTYCGQSFTRDEHLERHILTHTTVKPFKCFTCHMFFARRDLLQQHYTVHSRDSNNQEAVPPSVSSKPASRTPISCSNCVKTKVKCDKKFPCGRCAQRGLRCTLRPRRTLDAKKELHAASSTVASVKENPPQEMSSWSIMTPPPTVGSTSLSETPLPFSSTISEVGIGDDAGMFGSDTSTTSEEDKESSILQGQRRKVVDRVMEYFQTVLRVMPVNIRQVAGEASGGSIGEQKMLFNSSSDTPNAFSLPEKGLGKRRMPDEDSDTDNDDEPPSKQPKANDQSPEALLRRRKFACPYFKRNSERYIMRRSCVGPGWDEVRRVKEHLYRNHRLPIFCPRCYEVFAIETLLHAHQRADEPCAKRPEEAIEGFDAVQERSLKSRKKPKPELSEEEKWREMYRILFPDDDESMLPNPYLDCDWERVYQRGRVSGSNEVAQYEQFLRRELPAAVRRELEVAAEAEFTPLEERLKSQLIEIVRDVQLQLYRSYTRSRVSQTISDAVVTARPASPNNATQALGPTETALHNELASYEPAPPLDPTGTESFDAILFQLNDIEDFTDSAYGSLFDNAFPKEDWEDGSRNFFDPSSNNGEGSSR